MGKQIMEDIILKETEELVATISQRCKEDGILQMNNIFDVTVLNSLWSLMTGNRKLCKCRTFQTQRLYQFTENHRLNFNILIYT